MKFNYFGPTFLFYKCCFDKALKVQKAIFPLSLGHTVNDGLWHSVSLDTRSLQITVILDNEPAFTIEQWGQLEARGSFYFGGQ